MNCQDVQNLLPTYLDKALAPAEAEAVRTHLGTCSVCQGEEKLLALTWTALDALPMIRPSPDFRARFWERVRQEELETRNWWSVFQPKQLVPIMAGFMVIWTLGVAGGLYLFRGHPSRQAPLQMAADIFTSPLPPNSIEQAVLQGQRRAHAGGNL